MKQRRCDLCKKLFDVPDTGRPKRFCSARCRQNNHRRLVRAKGGLDVPDVLVDSDRWVRHIRKRPVTVEGRPASVSDPSSWSSFVTARQSRVGDGLGFVLGEGVGCIDLDGVISEGGELDPVARDLLDSLPTTWVEVSPSGKGLHVWGLIPEGPGRVLNVSGQRVEVYSRGRYITVTGDTFRGAPLRLASLGGVSFGR